MGHRDRQLESSRPGAARIDKHYPVSIFDQRLVRMAVDHCLEACCHRIEVKLTDVVQHVELNIANFHDFGQGQHVGPCSMIDVAAYGDHRGNGLQGVEDLR